MEVPYYLRPDVEPKGSTDLVFNIPITTTPVPSLNNMGSDMESLWERVSSGAESVVDRIKVTASDTYEDVTDFIKEKGGVVLDVAKAPFSAVSTAFNTTIWLMVAGVLTIIYLVVR